LQPRKKASRIVAVKFYKNSVSKHKGICKKLAIAPKLGKVVLTRKEAVSPNKIREPRLILVGSGMI
jgi:ribosomal protein L31E